MWEKFLSSVGVGVAKGVAATCACANAVVCEFARNAIDSNTRTYLMGIAVALILVMLVSFVVASKNLIAMLLGDAQNGVKHTA